ncbi:MAG: hypothetical protein AAGF55_08700, partial [Pseudomonadota bacterium]
RDALEIDDITSGVMFEAMSRVLLAKLLHGQRRTEDAALSAVSCLRWSKFAPIWTNQSLSTNSPTKSE